MKNSGTEHGAPIDQAYEDLQIEILSHKSLNNITCIKVVAGNDVISKGLMTETSVSNSLREIVGEQIDITQIKDVECNAGGNWITLADGRVYSIMVMITESEVFEA